MKTNNLKDLEFQVNALHFMENKKSLMDWEKGKKFFVAITAVPGTTALYNFSDENSMFEFCENFHKEVFGTEQKKNFYSELFKNCPNDSFPISSNVGINGQGAFPILCFGTKKHFNFFNNCYDRVMLSYSPSLREILKTQK